MSRKQKPAISQDGIKQLGENSKKSSTKRYNAAIEVDYLSAQLLAAAEQRLAAEEQAKLERDRADGLAKQVTSLDRELERVTKALEKSKSEAKRHLTIQQQLLAVARAELSAVNTSICMEQRNVAKLTSQLVLEQASKESFVKEPERMKEIIASERKKVEDLQ